jgi:hypothetical protein
MQYIHIPSYSIIGIKYKVTPGNQNCDFKRNTLFQGNGWKPGQAELYSYQAAATTFARNEHTKIQ